jgi:thiamine biosynthesis lipoprotein
MNPSLPSSCSDPAAAHDRFAALLEMGFRRFDPAPATTESLPLDDGDWRVTQLRPAMGSFVAVTALHESAALAEHAIGRALEEMDRLIGLLNRFDGSSALAVLNDAGHLDDAPGELTEVVAAGLAMGRRSAGAFDITVKPLVDLFRDPTTYAPRPPPADNELSAALELVGSARVSVEDRTVRLARRGMGLTLDGIAKGYIVDAMAAVLQRHGAARFLINAGGDIRAAGERGDARPWTIAVRDPGAEAPSWDSDAWQRNALPQAVSLQDGAVATSGSYEVYCAGDRSLHHIVQSRDGRSPSASLSVTVTAPTTVAADALATAVFVLGPEDGLRLIDRTPGSECLIIDQHRNPVRSRGWRGASAPAGEPA